MAGRAWGYWTRGKLDILERYLDAFTTTTKYKSSERIYIDAFAGEPENRDRLTGESIDGTARIALRIDDPPFTRLRFFETPANAPKLDTALRADFPDRDFKVLGGDCNVLIPKALDELRDLAWAPTFAFVDPNGMEAEWSTLEAIANFKAKPRAKAELWLLFAAPMFQRVLKVDGGQTRSEDAEAVDRLFGCRDWRAIYQAKLDGEIESAAATDAYLNLMRLSDLYARAASEFPAMRAEARRLRQVKELEDAGLFSLFGDDDPTLLYPVERGERFYVHEPPTRPWFLDP